MMERVRKPNKGNPCSHSFRSYIEIESFIIQGDSQLLGLAAEPRDCVKERVCETGTALGSYIKIGSSRGP